MLKISFWGQNLEKQIFCQLLMKMPSITPPISHHGISAKQIILLREELDIDDEMNEEETKEVDDDPYFLLAQRLANAPQVKVRFLRLQPTAMELTQYSSTDLYS